MYYRKTLLNLYLAFICLFLSFVFKSCKPKILVTECNEKVRYGQELERLRLKRIDSVQTFTTYKDCVIYKPSATVYDTLFVPTKETHNFTKYINDPSNLVQMRIEYDSLLHKYKIACESLEKTDTLKLRELRILQTLIREKSELDNIKKEYEYNWKDYLLIILAILILSFVGFLLIRKKLENRKELF